MRTMSKGRYCDAYWVSFYGVKRMVILVWSGLRAGCSRDQWSRDAAASALHTCLLEWYSIPVVIAGFAGFAVSNAAVLLPSVAGRVGIDAFSVQGWARGQIWKLLNLTTIPPRADCIHF